MTFGEKLQKLRTRAGLSQDQLAKLLDVSRQAVSKWERNEAMPEVEKLVRISRQFGVSTDYLLLEELRGAGDGQYHGSCGGPVGPGQAMVPEQGLSAGLGSGGLGCLEPG